MNLHRSTGSVLLPLWVAASLVGCQRPETQADSAELERAWTHRVEKPDVVLIVIDTLRKDHLGCYGYERATSPNIDALADRSIVYDNAFSQAPWTLPSVAALLTSRYPSELGIQGFGKRIPDEEVFLQEILSAHGYATHGIVSHDFVGPKWGFDQGFDSFQSFATGHRTLSSEAVTEAALEKIDRADDAPTFLFVHYFDPHFFYVEHEAYRFSGSPPDAESEWWFGPWRKLRTQANKGQLSEEKRDYLVDRYDSEIAFTDEHIGRLLDRLETTGRLQDSIVILTADHGEEFLDHGGLSHTTTVFNELINVPLIVKFPGSDEVRRSSRYVAHVDLLPTLLDYIGIPLDHDVAGIHLRDRTPSSPIVSETRRYRKLTAVIQDEVKLVADEGRSRIQFFDLEADPLEQQALVEAENGSRLLAELAEFKQRTQEGLARLEQEEDVEITAEELEKLRALGYVD